MLLYFSNTNTNIFDEESKKFGINIALERGSEFCDYINRNKDSLGYLDFLALDLSHIGIDEDEILKSLSSFKIFNENTPIIIVGLGRKQGDSFLARLFNENIYNFITSQDLYERQKEISNCFNKRNTHSSAIGYKTAVQNTDKKIKEKKNIFAFFSKGKKKHLMII